MKRALPRIVELDPRQIEDALAQAKAVLPEQTYQVLATIVEAYGFVLEQLARKRASIGRLKRMLFGDRTEKTATLLESTAAQKQPLPETPKKPTAKKPKVPGHGRNGAADYPQAKKVVVPHGKLKSGGICPGCRKGKVYEQAEPGVLVRVTGHAPLQAIIFELGKFRCNLCGEIYTARPPEGVGTKKYDATSVSMIANLKYGTGLPFHRLDRLQNNLGLPLPATTQWEIVSAAAKPLEPVFDELVRQAAQGKVLHNDDTTMKILARMSSRGREPEDAAAGHNGLKLKGERTGVFTSGIVSVTQDWRIALFFTGGRHAGENLEAVLARRGSGLAPPIQMCDALSRNVPSEKFKTFLANCLAHGRRQFVEVMENFPAECGHVLEVMRKVYIHDAVARKRAMTTGDRLLFHQEKSGPLMEKLHNWMERQMVEKRIEPNSGLGEAIGYMLKHWAELTLFLRRPGAPLDNNIVERALKKAILHRKNALFYKTDNGARVGDIYMSLIYTCEMNDADPFDYLTQLQRHAKQVREHPECWMPWNYPKAARNVGVCDGTLGPLARKAGP
ncbi:MAG: IS66 family transposase [Candidatus Portnoybacteria bacterium]|nr:IS66 family transposase [Candidatus Portnoybacteria bacterium]